MAEIQKKLKINNIRVLYDWKLKEHWESFCPPDTIEIAIARRINNLAMQEQKNTTEIKELEVLCKTFGDLKLKIAQAEKIKSEGRAIEKHGFPSENHFAKAESLAEQVHGPKKKGRGKGRKKTVKNDISSLTDEMFADARAELFWDYQILWHAQKQRNRFILKSRQIGATFYFAWEAFEDAVLTGDNQIFLSASRDQAEVFKAYIIAFAKERFEIELKGAGSILLSNGAELRFLSTNSRTAQSYHGHLYIDEVFWIPDFAKMFKVASAMAAHKKWRRTYFSTPSAQSHEAYPMWSGEKYNKGRADKNKADFDVRHKTLKNGVLGADKIWRHMVTVKDAEAQGCNLFDIDELQTEYNKDDFDNLFMCQFIDDAKGIFSLNDMLSCTLPDEEFEDYKPAAQRPFGNKPVAIGYDPSRNRDNASLIIMAVPTTPSGLWRRLAKLSFKNKNFEYQARRIEDVVNTHNVVHIGIDTTGIGLGVFELVESFFPMVTPIHYSVETKTRLVLKAMSVIPDRLRYPISDQSMTQSFMMIKKTITGSGNQITYAANRSSETGHADEAWATMHALTYEPLNPNEQKTTVSIPS